MMVVMMMVLGYIGWPLQQRQDVGLSHLFSFSLLRELTLMYHFLAFMESPVFNGFES